MLLDVPTGGSSKLHVCELQVQLRRLADTRVEVHKLYRSVRETIPKTFKVSDADRIKDVGEVIKKVRGWFVRLRSELWQCAALPHGGISQHFAHEANLPTQVLDSPDMYRRKYTPPMITNPIEVWSWESAEVAVKRHINVELKPLPDDVDLSTGGRAKLLARVADAINTRNMMVRACPFCCHPLSAVRIDWLHRSIAA